MMDRRRFVSACAGSLVITPSIVKAQPAGKVYRVGFLLGATEESVVSLFRALKEGLQELGYIEGRNLVLDRRYGDGKMERLPDLAGELVRAKVEVIVTGTNIHVAAARRVTSTIPIVMVFADDPVRAGFVASLARPGGNVTGLSADASSELWGKYLSMLKELVPKLSRVGVLGQMSSNVGFAELAAASRKLDVALDVGDLRTAEDLDGAFDAMNRKHVGAVLVIVGPLTYLLRQRISELALKFHLPAITNVNQFTQVGLLMSYGPNLPDLYRRAASYVDKILRGATAADLPVEQPSKFELTINLKTARSLGVVIPNSLLLTAAEVIQ
jgi:putative ABC transport system substrate-binding protein